MLIYKGPTTDFVRLNRLNRLASLMCENFHTYTGYYPNQNEIQSWQNSLSRVCDLVELSELRDNYVALEYFVPYNDRSRIDCLLFGRNVSTSSVYLIELKQWSSVDATKIEGNFVETFTGGSKKVVAHPSQQVKGYHN